MTSEVSRAAVFAKSAPVDADSQRVVGPELRGGRDAAMMAVAAAATGTGFQATHLGRAEEILFEALEARQAPEAERLTLFCGFAANLFGTGCREALVYLGRHGLMDACVVSGGGVEHDLRRLFPYHDYRVTAYASASAGVPPAVDRVCFGNVSYRRGPCPADGAGGTCCFEHCIASMLPAIVEAPQYNRVLDVDDFAEGRTSRRECFGSEDSRVCFTPSRFWKEVAMRLKALLPPETLRSSFAVACADADIPIFSPNLTDGDVAELLLAEERLTMDLVGDLGELNRMALKAHRSGMFIVGGGIVKHHVCNANLMRNGADYAVFVNSAQEYDGSDAGARPDEAVSWGKIRITAKHVKVYTEASLVLPLLIERSFVRWAHART